MTSRLLISEMYGLAGRADELERLLDDLAEDGRGERACLRFSILRRQDVGDVVVVAHWRDEARCGSTTRARLTRATAPPWVSSSPDPATSRSITSRKRSMRWIRTHLIPDCSDNARTRRVPTIGTDTLCATCRPPTPVRHDRDARSAPRS